MPARRYTVDDLQAILGSGEVQTMADLCRALGIVPRGANYETLRRFGRQHGIDVDAALPSPALRDVRRWRQVPDEDIADALRAAISIAEALRLLGFGPTAARYRRCREIIRRHELDLSHHTGQGWKRGRRDDAKRKPAESYLVSGRLVRTSKLREKLIDDGLKDRRCEDCRRATWRGGPIPLELDHVDGDRRNNRLENLRLRCPNCHALTPTYRGRNIGRQA